MAKTDIVNRLTRKELYNLKLQALFIFVGCAFVLQLWFAFRSHVFLKDSVGWQEVVATQTRVSSRQRRSDQHLVTKTNIKIKPTEESTKSYSGRINRNKNGRLLSMIWDNICCQSINSLRKNPLFPLLPSDTRFLRSLRVADSGRLYAQRIAGRLAPPISGNYSFFVKCMASCEIWLSENEFPLNTRLFQKVVRGISGNSSKEVVELSSNKEYFIDILVTVYREVEWPLEVFWKVPNSKKFVLVTQRFFGNFPGTSLRTILKVFARSDAVRLTSFLESIEEEGEDDEEFKTIGKDRPYISGSFFDFQEKKISVKRSLNDTSDVHVKKFQNVLLSLKRCDYKPSYLTNTSLPKYSGIWRTLFTSVFPGDNTGYMRCIGNRYPYDCEGNEGISTETVQTFLRLYTQALNMENSRWADKNDIGHLKVVNVRNIEEKKDAAQGTRFLVEATVANSLLKFSHSTYLYMNKQRTSLCVPRGIVVDMTTTVNVVIIVKNQSRWFRHFLANMEKIYVNTNENKLKIIVAYYGREDAKLMKEFKSNRLPHIHTIRHFGKFHKTKAIQSAVNTIRDSNSIIFLMDLHIVVPDTMISLVRKHTIQGRMVFNPVLFRLSFCGSIASNAKAPIGFWETFGYGVLGIYKSDWDRIGGMSSKKYNRGWGGEDWELLDRIISAGLEVERLRVPNFYHFYHSKNNMWN